MMARKTFISYKYSESKELRDKILEALGEDARYYKGETSESPDRTDQTTDTIKNALKDMIYQTSVLIVIASPDMNSSNWIEWEIKYALRSQKRGDTTSQPNGVVVVIKEESGSVAWLMNRMVGDDGCNYRNYNNHYLPEIIKANRFNRKTPEYSCEHCATYSSTEGSYITIATQKEFLDDPGYYIENAYNKSKNLDLFDLTKE